MKTKRLFIALPLSGGVKKNLVELQDELREQMPEGWRWAGSETFHITLRFLGEVGDEDIADVCRMADDAVDGIEAFEYRLETLGVFPKPASPKVLWVGVGGHVEPIHELNRRLEEAALELGFRAEGKAYRPHVTLARSARGQTVDTDALAAAMDKLQGHEVAKVFAKEVITYNSLLTREGPVYEVLARAGLER